MAVIISRRSSYCPNFATAPFRVGGLFGGLDLAEQHDDWIQQKRYMSLANLEQTRALIAANTIDTCQMRVLGTGVPETRYCRVPGSWYRGGGAGGGPGGWVFVAGG
ncbi:hypothetical protein ACL1H7_11195, partial [Corynebacterium striatum]